MSMNKVERKAGVWENGVTTVYLARIMDLQRNKKDKAEQNKAQSCAKLSREEGRGRGSLCFLEMQSQTSQSRDSLRVTETQVVGDTGD